MSEHNIVLKYVGQAWDSAYTTNMPINIHLPQLNNFICQYHLTYQTTHGLLHVT